MLLQIRVYVLILTLVHLCVFPHNKFKATHRFQSPRFQKEKDERKQGF